LETALGVMESRHGKKANWLLRTLIGISLGIHAVVFMHVAGIYRSSNLSYIELTVREISKPNSRNIPRPRARPKNPVQPGAPQRLDVPSGRLPAMKPLRIEPAEKTLPDTAVEEVSMPHVPDMGGLKIAKWNEDRQLADPAFLSTDHYLEMVRIRIESHKDYPEIARRRRVEGRTTVRFTIRTDGRVSDVKVVKGTRSRVLNRAAVLAVEESSPFPKPPPDLFTGPISLEVTLVFELT